MAWRSLEVDPIWPTELKKRWIICVVVAAFSVLPNISNAESKACHCPDANTDSVRSENRRFITEHINRIQGDIRGLRSNLDPQGAGRTRRAWQRVADQALLEQKEQILRRLTGYQSRLGQLPNVRLLVQDLYRDFDEKKCTQLPDDELPAMVTNKRTNRSPLLLGPPSKFNASNLQDDEAGMEALARSRRQREAALIAERCAEVPRNSPTCGAPVATSGQSPRSADSREPSPVECDCRTDPTRIQAIAQVLENQRGCGESVLCVESRNDFLRTLGVPIRRIGGGPTERDLSNWFSAPQSQGDSLACMGFAVAADIEAHLYKASLGGLELPPPDPWSTYQALRGRKGLTCEGRSEGGNYRATVVPREGMRNLARTELCLTEGVQARVAVEQSVSLDRVEGVDFEFFQQLIDNDRPVTIGLKSSRRELLEDWIRPQPGGPEHAVSVVGYGRGVNPVTLCEEPYVIVRDSLEGRPSHFRMSFNDLRQNLVGVEKIRSLKVQSIQSN